MDGSASWWLGIVHHPDPEYIGRRVPLPRGTKLELGREAGCFGPQVLHDGRISRRHAVVQTSEQGEVEIIDRKSRNGTFVNGNRVRQLQLGEGDVVGLGSILLLLHQAPAFFKEPRHETLIGVSWPISKVVEEIAKVAPYPTCVLVLGETGTGKELVAREIHRASGRTGPMHSVNCGGVSDNLLQSELFGHVRGAYSGADRERAGIIEAADGGTVFLDEIGDASPALQVSLLRFLQEGEIRRIGANRTITVDTRVVAATHRDLKAMVAAGTFREDLHARLTGWVIEIAPLRARREDIPHLVDHFVKLTNTGPRKVHHRLARRMLAYDWPANVRELRAIIERAVIEAGTSDTLSLTTDLEELLRPRPPQSETGPATPATTTESAGPRPKAKRPTGEELANLIVARDGNIRLVSKELGVARNTLYRWIKDAEIDLEALREDMEPTG